MAQKSIFDKQVLIFIAAICLLALIVGSVRVACNFKTTCPDVKIIPSTDKIIENTPFSVKAISPGITSWEWDFGDNKPHQTGNVVTYTYSNAGKYNIKLTVNDNPHCSTYLTVNVASDMGSSGGSSGLQIDGPITAFVNQTLTYRESSGKGEKWAWSNSESTQVDGTGSSIKYSFATPGHKTIYLTMNGNLKGSLDVEVQAAGGGAKPKCDDKDFGQKLRQVIDRKGDVNLFKDCLCGKLNLLITVVEKGKGTQLAFDKYCKQVRSANYKTEIEEVKLTVDGTGCITGIVIKQHSTKWAPFR